MKGVIYIIKRGHIRMRVKLNLDTVEVMANSTHSNSVALDDAVLAAPVLVIAVIIFVVVFAVVVVLVYKRNRQARSRRLRESAQIATRRLQTAIELKQVNRL